MIISDFHSASFKENNVDIALPHILQWKKTFRARGGSSSASIRENNVSEDTSTASQNNEAGQIQVRRQRSVNTSQDYFLFNLYHFQFRNFITNNAHVAFLNFLLWYKRWIVIRTGIAHNKRFLHVPIEWSEPLQSPASPASGL